MTGSVSSGSHGNFWLRLPSLGWRLAGLVLLLLGCSWPAAAEIRIERLADGTLHIVGRAGAAPAARSVLARRAPEAELGGLIDLAADREGLDRVLVRAVIQAESDYDPQARSSKGAIGLMQLMPETARELGVDPTDPEQNLRGGTRYLRQMLDRFDGRLDLALAAYNAGPGAVTAHRGAVPPYRETTAYLRKVLGLYRGETPLARPAVAASVATEAAPAVRYRRIEEKRRSDGTLELVTRD